MEAWQSQPLDALDLVGLILDGVHVGEHCLIVALGIAADGDPVKLVVAEDRIRRRAGLAIAGVHSVDELPAVDQIADSPLLAGAALTDEGLVGIVDVEQLFAQLAEGSR